MATGPHRQVRTPPWPWGTSSSGARRTIASSATTVTEVKADPAGTAPRKELAIEWMTYAFTGCSGAVSTTAAASFAWGDLPDLGGTSLTAPIRHGPFQLVPAGWSGSVEVPETYPSPGYSATDPIATTDLAEARKLPYWRDPALPLGSRLARATSGYVTDPIYGYTATYRGGESDVTIWGYHAAYRGAPEETSWLNARGVFETRIIAGRPAAVMYSPVGTNHDRLFPVTVWIYDPATDALYWVLGENKSLLGSNVDAVIAIARSLFEPPNAPAAFAYTTYDATGQATTPGSYAFLDEAGAVVTTYEALRDRTTTGLRIHTSDAYGASQTDTYGGVAVGDVFEWRKSENCWIRYLVTSAPAPAAGATTRDFGVKWMTYTYTGCSGAIPANAAVKVGWDPPSLDWRDVTSPVWHGPFILTPRDRSGPRAIPPATYPGPTSSVGVTGEQGGPWPSTDPPVVRTHPLWRDPDLPDGWVLGFLGATADLVEARYGDGEGYFALEIYVVDWHGRWITRRALADVIQVTLIDGNPAVVEAHGSIVTIFDESTGVKYIVYAHDPSIRENAEAVIAIARSLMPEQGGS